MRTLYKHLPWLLIITVLSLLLTRNIWGTRAWIETHDGIFHLIRFDVFASMVRLGQFPVRWAGSLDNGFGIPLFNYVYPGPYLLGLPFYLLGIGSKWIMKMLEVGLYTLGGIGVYLNFARRDKRWAAFASCIYLMTPYLLLNIFIRGALGEFMAMAVMPWVMLAGADLTEHGKIRWYHPLPLALLFISHNFLSFLFLPVYLVMMFLRRAHFARVMGSMLLSFGLASFFVIPMILERGLVYSGAADQFTYSYKDSFVYPLQLLWGKWGNGYSVPGTGDGMTFQLGIANLMVILASFWLVIKKRAKPVVVAWVIILSLIIFGMLPVSQPVWDILTPVQVIQFPWRLLALATLVVTFLSFEVVLALPRRFQIPYVSVAVLGALFFALRFTTPFYFQNNDQLADQFYVHREQTTTSSRLELLPRWALKTERWRGDVNARVERGSADMSAVSPSSVEVDISSNTADADTVYLVRRNYFPSWHVRDETGKKLAVEPSLEGEIIFHPDVGLHHYRIFVGNTPVENWGNAISLCAILSLVLLELYNRKHIKPAK